MIKEMLVEHNNILPGGDRQQVIRKAANGMAAIKNDPESHGSEILFITSYPPRECGIATYSQDLVRALNNKFSHSFKINICPVESDIEKHVYTLNMSLTLIILKHS
jgi:hypothetical protein